jgi:hypothetical protein
MFGAIFVDHVRRTGARETITVSSAVDTEVRGRIGSRTRRELTTETPRRQGINPKHEIRNSKQTQMTKISSFQANPILIGGFEFSPI